MLFRWFSLISVFCMNSIYEDIPLDEMFSVSFIFFYLLCVFVSGSERSSFRQSRRDKGYKGRCLWEQYMYFWSAHHHVSTESSVPSSLWGMKRHYHIELFHTSYAAWFKWGNLQNRLYGTADNVQRNNIFCFISRSTDLRRIAAVYNYQEKENLHLNITCIMK